jgi:hypothetical protein
LTCFTVTSNSASLLHTRELFLEPGDELARADHQRRVLCLAAFELVPVDAADEVDDQLVAVGGLLRFRRLGVDFLVRGQPL